MSVFLTLIVLLTLLFGSKTILSAFGPLGWFSAIFIGFTYGVASLASAIGISFTDFLQYGCFGLLILSLFGRALGWHNSSK